MICPQCGQDNPSEARFCGKCATALSAPVRQSGTSPVAGEVVSPGMKIGIIVGTVFIPLLGIIMGLIYMNDPHPQKKAVGRTWLYVGIGIVVLYCGFGFMIGLLGSLGGGGEF